MGNPYSSSFYAITTSKSMNLSIYSEEGVKHILSKSKILLKKSLGQNLLLDPVACDAIAAAAGTLENEIVIEIGPGIGNLTNAILKNKPSKLIAIEKDISLKTILNQLELKHPELTVEYEDALRVNVKDLAEHPVHIFGNLPYNISTQLIFKWMEERCWIKSLTLTLQSEVSDRICAAPGTKDYGKLSILSQIFFDCTKVLKLKSGLFFPIPKVDSTTVHMVPKTQIPDKSVLDRVRFITATAFSQRRKMLRQSLKSAFKSPVDACKNANISPQSRAENVTVEQYIQLAQLLIESGPDVLQILK